MRFSKFICDIFAGTGIIGKKFNNLKTKVISNDFLLSNYICLQSFLGIHTNIEESIIEKIKLCIFIIMRGIDLIFADPPYNLSGNRLKWKGNKTGGDWYMVNEEWDKMPVPEYLQFTRKWIGIEKDKEYVEIAKKRMEKNH